MGIVEECEAEQRVFLTRYIMEGQDQPCLAKEGTWLELKQLWLDIAMGGAG